MDLPAIDERLGKLVLESSELREVVLQQPWSVDDPPRVLHEATIRIRRALDRVEGIVAELTQIKGQSAELLADRKAAYEDRWNVAARQSQVGFGYEDPAPRERYAAYEDASTAERFKARSAEKLDRQVSTALEVCKIHLRGLDGARRDLETRLRIVSMEVSLER